MIKFFRHIRQRLLSENKFSKYLLYAIGEIILVVIGILIAIAINDNRQDLENRDLGKELLSRLHSDLVRDTVQFRNTINSNQRVRADIKSLLVRLYQGAETIEDVKEMSETFDTALDQVFSINDNTYKSMVGSGNLRLIQNQQLKEEIIGIYSEYEQHKELLSAINQWMLGITVDVDKKTDFLKFNKDVFDIYTLPEMVDESDFSFINNTDDPKFELLVRAVSATAFNQKVRTTSYINLIDRCKILLKKIEQEINDTK